jgi:hypothetical protein
MSVYTKQRVDLSRARRVRLVVENPYEFFLCLLDIPLKLAAKAVGVGDDRVKRVFIMLMDAPVPWPCKEIYDETHRLFSKRMVVAARNGEIFRLRGLIARNEGDLLNARELLRVLERAELYAGNYGVVKTGRPSHRERGALAAVGVSERWGEPPEGGPCEAEPWPAELPFHEEFDLDMLFREGKDELGLGV